ncbi:MAG TPA: PEP-CTERM sorting domain-containing protein [Tepidisphaeraceae bacterium]|nr:PEP-CTERM sorting domain-containing protein [Tepidisphaeraceae bacterium]
MTFRTATRFAATIFPALFLVSSADATIIRDFGNGVGFNSVGTGTTQNASDPVFVALQKSDAATTARADLTAPALLAGESNEFLQIVLRRGANDTQSAISLELSDTDGTTFKYTGGFSLSGVGTTSFVTLTATKNLSSNDSVSAAGSTTGLNLSSLSNVRLIGSFGSGQVLDLQIDAIQTTAAVPEPTSLAVLGAVAGIPLLRRRRRA